MKARALFGAAIALLGAGAAHAQYDKQGVRFLSNIPLSAFPGAPTSGAAIYGYTSPGGREIALMQLRNGTGVVDITNPTNPVQIAHISGPLSLWHEVVVLGSYAYAVTDNVGIGVQIIDLNNVDNGVATLAGVYTGVSPNVISTVHTIQADPVTRRLYLNGSNRGLVILDATNPTAPFQVGRWTTRYVHDGQLVKYTSGPYAGKDIYFACTGGAGLTILDVTNPAAIVQLAVIDYLGNNYTHSGQLSADKKYFMINDEFDEGNGLVTKATTHIINVENLSAPTYAGAFSNNGNFIDHNSDLRNGFLFLAAYKGGLRIYNAANPLAMSEAGYFDTFPGGDGMSYEGNWGVFAQYPSGNVALSDMQRGLFVVDPSEAIGLGAPIVNLTADKLVSGNAASLKSTDGNAATITFDFTSADRVENVQIATTHESTITPAARVDVKFVGRVGGALSASTQVRIWRWDTNQWASVGTGNLNATSDTTIQTFGLNNSTGSYVNAQGQIRLSVVASPSSNVKSFNLIVDELRATVRRS